jgi:hypothetical protein
MLQAWLADAVLAAHGVFILWSCLGGLAALRWPRAAWLHLPTLAWSAGISLVGGICPLTPLEVELRQAAGQQGYTGGFIEHYLTAAIYPDGLTRGVQVAGAAVLVAFNVALYAWVWRRARGRRKARAG